MLHYCGSSCSWESTWAMSNHTPNIIHASYTSCSSSPCSPCVKMVCLFLPCLSLSVTHLNSWMVSVLLNTHYIYLLTTLWFMIALSFNILTTGTLSRAYSLLQVSAFSDTTAANWIFCGKKYLQAKMKLLFCNICWEITRLNFSTGTLWNIIWPVRNCALLYSRNLTMNWVFACMWAMLLSNSVI